MALKTNTRFKSPFAGAYGSQTMQTEDVIFEKKAISILSSDPVRRDNLYARCGVVIVPCVVVYVCHDYNLLFCDLFYLLFYIRLHAIRISFASVRASTFANEYFLLKSKGFSYLEW